MREALLLSREVDSINFTGDPAPGPGRDGGAHSKLDAESRDSEPGHGPGLPVQLGRGFMRKLLQQKCEPQAGVLQFDDHHGPNQPLSNLPVKLEPQ